MCMYKIFGNILPNTHSTYVTITQFPQRNFFWAKKKIGKIINIREETTTKVIVKT